MPTTPPLSLSNIIDISVTVEPTVAAGNTFNQGLCIGNSGVIPSQGANSRLRQYPSTTAMLSDGFTTTDPEFIEVGIYFSQTPPAQFVWVGCQDATAIGALVLNTGGTGWAVGDQFNVVQAGASAGLGVVTAVTAGVATAVSFVSGAQGTGYAVASGLTTTAVSPSTGISLTVNVTGIGETLLQAATACRAASSIWYGLMVTAPTDADNLALSAWADPLWQSTKYYPWSNDSAIPAGTAGNLFLQLQALNLRVLATYATVQGGLFPNNIYAAAAIMGVDMGLNTGLAGSYFITAHKVPAGIAPEPLTQTQYTNIINAGGNVYGDFGPQPLYEPGLLSNGALSTLWINLAVLVQNLQLNELAVLVDNPVVSQTNSGEQLLIHGANQACLTSANIGFLADGVWRGATINIPGVSLTPGQAISGGYLVQAQPYSQQSVPDHDAGKGMPLYIAVTSAGGVLSLVIGVFTQL
jgi:hypothetical protein